MRALTVFLLLINSLYGYSVPIFSGAKNIGDMNVPIYSGVEIVVAGSTPACDTARLDSVVNFPSQVKSTVVYYGDTVFEKGSICDGIVIDSGNFNGVRADTLWHSDSGAAFLITEAMGVGWVLPIWDWPGAVEPDTADSFYIAGLYDTATIATDPSAQSKYIGETATFSVTATGTAPLTYQWFCDSGGGAGVYEVVAGETNSSIELLNVKLIDNGWLYSCGVYNDRGGDTSSEASLTVQEGVRPIYTLTLSSNNTVYGTLSSYSETIDSGTSTVITATETDSTHLYNVEIISGTVDTVSTGLAYTITVHSDAVVRFDFGIDTFTLTEVPDANGSVTYVPDAEGSSPRSYDYGTWVRVEAVPAPGYSFVRWQGGILSSTTAIDSVRVDDFYVIQPVLGLIPVVDSIKNLRRRDFYWAVGRPLDTLIIYASNSSFDNNCKVFVGATQSTEWATVIQSTPDSIRCTVPEAAPSNYYRLSIESEDGVMSDLPSNHNYYIKIPGGL
jgi:hypothetical protein